MSRGGYILIISFVVCMFGYQTYTNERMLDRYDIILKDTIESKVMAEKPAVADTTTDIQLAELKDSIIVMSKVLLSSSVNKPQPKRVVETKNSYIKNFYITQDTAREIMSDSEKNTPLLKTIDLITNSD